MSNRINDVLLVIAMIGAVAVELCIIIAIAYGVLRFATQFLQMRRDIEELKREVRKRSSNRKEDPNA